MTYADTKQGHDYWKKWHEFIKDLDVTIDEKYIPRIRVLIPFIRRLPMANELKDALLKDLYDTGLFGMPRWIKMDHFRRGG